MSLIPFVLQSEALMDDYVANSFRFSDDATSVCILTGPNMAGESTSLCVRLG